MNDRCSDAWAGRIPVCAVSGAAQQQENGACAARAAHDDQDSSIMMERDYISLGLTGAPQEVPTGAYYSDEKMECDNVELCLGLGCPDKTSTQDVSPSEQCAADEQFMAKSCKSQQFWHQNFRVSFVNDRMQHVANQPPMPETAILGSSNFGKGYAGVATAPHWSPGPGRFMVPVPKVSTTPAKRPHHGGASDRRTEAASNSVMHPASAVYAWNSDHYNPSTLPVGGWHNVHVNYDQAHAHGGVASPAGHAFGLGLRHLVGVQPPSTTGFKVPHPPSNVSMPPPSATTGGPSTSQPEPDHDGNRSKAPVVGWPPIRSYRRSTLQAAQMNSKGGPEDLVKGMNGASTSQTSDVLLDAANVPINKSAFFVKAKLDGVRICRKVDLKAYDSYNQLKLALQEMFQGFVSDVAKLDLLNGKYYVLTHEDKDGDCLLVGDVPWHMFLESSVKSLRIMKAVDANGIGEKGCTKAKAQDNGKP